MMTPNGTDTWSAQAGLINGGLLLWLVPIITLVLVSWPVVVVAGLRHEGKVVPSVPRFLANSLNRASPVLIEEISHQYRGGISVCGMVVNSRMAGSVPAAEFIDVIDVADQVELHGETIADMFDPKTLQLGSS